MRNSVNRTFSLETACPLPPLGGYRGLSKNVLSLFSGGDFRCENKCFRKNGIFFFGKKMTIFVIFHVFDTFRHPRRTTFFYKCSKNDRKIRTFLEIPKMCFFCVVFLTRLHWNFGNSENRVCTFCTFCVDPKNDEKWWFFGQKEQISAGFCSKNSVFSMFFWSKIGHFRKSEISEISEICQFWSILDRFWHRVQLGFSST